MRNKDLSQESFAAKEVNALLGVDNNKLFHWINTHRLLKPDIDEGIGRGKKRVFSRNNLLEIAIVSEMTVFGIELNAVKKFKDFLDKWNIKTTYEDGRWVETKEKNNKKIRKFSLYDWAFEGGQETGLKLYYQPNGIHLDTMMWADRPETEEDKKEMLSPGAYLVINVSTIARKIMDKIGRV